MTGGGVHEGGRPLRWRLVGDEGGQAPLFHPDRGVQGTGSLAGLELFHVRARSVLNRVPERSRVPFRWTINAYRGCSHACAYCFARPTHEYLGLDGGGDFDRRIVVKVNAVEVARAELSSPRWTREAVAMGTNTDPYQPVEGRYRLTRGLIGALADVETPFSLLTKSTLIGRDIDVLADAARRGLAHAALSVGTLDRAVWRASEPHAPDPRRRMRAVARLNAAGVPCGVMIAPVLPGLSDAPDQLEEVVRAALDAGAVSVTPIMLHLRPGVRDHYLTRIRAFDPAHADAMAQRYARPYGPTGAARDLTARVREIVDRHGGTRRMVDTPIASGAAPRVGGAPRAPQPAPAQLSLL
jgi:DNA repair photolyase